MNRIETAIKSGITSALTVASAQTAMQSAEVASMAEAAFREQWPDGITLSDRLWKFGQDTRSGITDVLEKGIRQGAAVNRIVMDMQRTIERTNAGQLFKIVERQKDDWVKDLHYAAQTLIHNPDAKAQWNDVVDEVEARILMLEENGTRRAAERVLSQVRRAVEKGSEELLDNAVKWWVYDKQLYNLKRIARTEMATAAHRAVIASTVEDEDIIGYQWRLASTHPRPDFCDYYASIDMGLGKGVWTKDAVPHHKAHPHCMCLLIPRTTPIKTPGNANYRDFIEHTTPEQREQLLPKWVQQLNALGMPLSKMIRNDGLGLLTRQILKERMGEERFNAATALGKAAYEAKWPVNKIRPNNKMSRSVMDVLKANRDKPDVDRFLNELEASGFKIDSLEWHYFKYKYYYGELLANKNEFNRRFDPVFKDLSTEVFRPGDRYVLYSKNVDRMAYVSPEGLRISIYKPTPDELENLGKPLWTIQDLIN